MSYDFRMVYTKMWREDRWFATLDTSSKLLWLWLLTNSSANAAGVYEIRPEMVAVETGLTAAMVDAALTRFEVDGKLKRDQDVVWIRKMREYQTRGSRSPKIQTAVRNSLRAIRDCPLKVAYADAYGEELAELLQNSGNLASLVATPEQRTMGATAQTQAQQDPYQTTLQYLTARQGVNGRAFNPLAALVFLFNVRFGTTSYRADYGRLGKIANMMGDDYVALAKLIWQCSLPEGDPHNYLQGAAKRSPLARKMNGTAPAPPQTTSDEADEFWRRWQASQQPQAEAEHGRQ